MELTRPAQRVVKELEHSWNINWQVRTALLDGESSKQAIEDSPNLRFYSHVESYLSARQITHAADSFITYCQAIFALVIRCDPKQVRAAPTGSLPKIASDCIALLESHAPGTSAPAMKALRDGIKALWSRELEVIVKLRHILVHSDGWDSSQIIKEVSNDSTFPWCPIPPPDVHPSPPPFYWSEQSYLLLDSRHAHWATRHIQHHIYLMDQNLSHRFCLPRTRFITRSSSRSFQTSNRALPPPPGTPLPYKRDFPAVGTEAATTPELPTYSNIMDPTEKNCVDLWRQGQAVVDKWVRDYSASIEVSIRRVNCGIAGRFLGHTCEGHDIALEYYCTPRDDDSRGEWICFRFRQKHFQPFMTIWSSSGQMLDTKSMELTSELQEILKRYIEKALAK